MSELPEIPGYRIVRPLGAGGMGSVYVVEKLATHQEYAVKLLREDHLVNEKSLTRFSREIKALRSIRHPHVVSVFDWSVPQPDAYERPYVVMELLEGEGLDRLLRRRRNLPPSLAVSIMLQVLDGLSAVHELGIIHRDLGPSNVFITPQANGKYLAKVLDFGLARSREPGEDSANVTQAGTLMGKPGYVAPEMFRGEKLDVRSDIYACGVILFRMLAGQLPYEATQARMLWAERYAERNQPVERPSVRNYVPTIPEKLDTCVAKALRTSPAERYQTAEDMQADLLDLEDAVLDLGPTKTLPVLPAPEVVSQQATGSSMALDVGSTLGPRPRRRWPIFVAAGGGAALALTLVLALAVGGGGDDGREHAAPGTTSADAGLLARAAPGADGADLASGKAVVPGSAPIHAGGEATLVDPSADAGRAPGEIPGTTPLDVAAGAPDAGPEAVGLAPDAGTGSVHFAFAEVPDDSRVTVDGREVDARRGVDLPRSGEPVVVFVTAPRTGLLAYRTTLVPDQDRTITPRFRRAGSGSRDASTVIHGPQGTTFVIDLGGHR